MRKTQKKHRKLLQSGENCIIIEINPNNVKRINIELLSATPSDQSDLFVFNNGQAHGENIKNNISNRDKKGVVKEKKMESINILDAAKYLIQLYYKTKRNDNKHYRCTCTQLEKLLIIANLIYFVNNKILFKDEMWLTDCGVSIPLLKHYFYTIIIDEENTNKPISSNELNINLNYPEKYAFQNILSDDVKILLSNVFLRFGGYSAVALGEMFDEFKANISVQNPIDENHPLISNKPTVAFFFDTNVSKDIQKNEVYAFIHTYEIN